MSKDKEVKPKGMAGGIPVYCAHDEIVDIIKLISCHCGFCIVLCCGIAS